MSKNNFITPQMNQTLKDMAQTAGLANNLMKNIPNTSILKSAMTGINLERPTYPAIDTSQMDEFYKQRAKEKREELEREIENNESLKGLVVFNQQLVDYNQQLVILNEGILRKIDVIGSTMNDITKNIKEGGRHSKESDEEQTRLLLELISIMESKENKNNLGEFLKGLTGDVAAGLITAYLQYKIGLS